ncbi:MULTISPECIES: peptidoglycan-binding protein [unclassified Streptomyces]|uniref:peptidoglycan-binding protein n=1 Tax=unclassified Streptomyces TaxID=2593676 RepID=UPI00166185DD|nr:MULTISPECIES: peptidoglycan-binding protein [unclassified Streptomyces]MBD0707920.1 hypothetical protein [Streptomyces sp. CBMA291]MBD0715080.1 hypothetical protein [Streptomyces sp. CBMA370]
MSVPVFEEIEPAADCGCPGCARRRRDLALGLAVADGGHPAAHGARRALVMMTAAGMVLGGGGAASAMAPAGTGAEVAGQGTSGTTGTVRTAAVVPVDNPQGRPEPLHGGSGAKATPFAAPMPGQGPTTGLRQTTRTEIVNRAKLWVNAKVPYSMNKYWSDGYRQDCSGYISMAWNLPGNEWTGSLARFADRIDRADLQPGDILLFHNNADPTRGSHVTIFGGWTDYTHTSYIAYEQAKPHTRKQATPMAYWNHADQYVAYRYKGVVGGGDTGSTGGTGNGGSTPEAGQFPGTAMFGPGASNAHVTRLGELLVQRGGKKFYSQGPGPTWGEADRRATQAFQQAQGWKGAEADGLPGPGTWKLLVGGGGKDIGGTTGTGTGTGTGGGTGTGPGTGTGIGGSSGSGGSSTPVTDFPGRGSFRPGQSNAYVETLGRQLVKRGFGKHYTSGPGPRWTEADRRNVEAFQRAQGWRDAAADGYPGPETWRRLFR